VAEKDDSAEVATNALRKNKFDLKECKAGPKKMFTVKTNGISMNVFMGDVNDILNIECLYLMDAVITVGKFSHIDNVVKIFRKPTRNSKKVIKKMKSPFTNKKLTPSKTKKTKINKNLSVLSFKIGEKKTAKSLFFYHIFKKNAKRNSQKVFKTLAKKLKNKKANILYLVDHLQEKSLEVFKSFLKRFAKYTNKKLAALKYKKMLVFK